MSATLTWFHSGNGTKTGTAVGDLFANLKTLIDTVSPGSDFLWEVKGSNTGSTPYYISIGRKDGSAGRIALIAWTSNPAGNNSAILDTTPNTTYLQIAWFPAGTGTTLANLTASSGAITGDDTNCVKVASLGNAITTIYTTNVVPYYFECQEGMVFGFQNPAGSGYWCGAGDLVVDFSDNAYGCTFGSAVIATNFGATTDVFAWTPAPTLAGTTTSGIRSNYGAANSSFFHGYRASATWGSATPANSLLVNTATQDVWFAPMPLIGQVKGDQFPLKWRQIGMGPGTTSAFTVYNTTGPVVAARQFNNNTGGSTGAPWFVNDKL